VKNEGCGGVHLFHGFGESGGEEQHLAVGSDVAQDAHYLRLKSKVEHAVGFVYNDKGDAAQVSHAAGVGSEHVDHAPWGADHDVRATLQLRNLQESINREIRCAPNTGGPVR
jgi:hypothetical protein